MADQDAAQRPKAIGQTSQGRRSNGKPRTGDLNEALLHVPGTCLRRSGRISVPVGLGQRAERARLCDVRFLEADVAGTATRWRLSAAMNGQAHATGRVGLGVVARGRRSAAARMEIRP